MKEEYDKELLELLCTVSTQIKDLYISLLERIQKLERSVHDDGK